MFQKYINTKVFLVSLFLGMLIAYMFVPTPRVIYKFPNPLNPDFVFQNTTGDCYKYKAKQIECPKDNSAIPLPVNN